MLFFVCLKFNDAQKQIGLTKYKYFFFTSLSGEWVSAIKNSGDFVMRPQYIIGLPDAQKRYIQKHFARASAVRILALSVFFGAITAPEFKSISVVRMCER